MKLRKQLELLRDLLAAAREQRSRAVSLERLARRLAVAWDAEDRASARSPGLRFPEPKAQPASTQELEEPRA